VVEEGKEKRERGCCWVSEKWYRKGERKVGQYRKEDVEGK
jgi:hypothetical protein